MLVQNNQRAFRPVDIENNVAVGVEIAVIIVGRIAVKEIAVVAEEIKQGRQSRLELVVVQRRFPSPAGNVFLRIEIAAQREIVIGHALCVVTLNVAEEVGIESDRSRKHGLGKFPDWRAFRCFRVRRETSNCKIDTRLSAAVDYVVIRIDDDLADRDGARVQLLRVLVQNNQGAIGTLFGQNNVPVRVEIAVIIVGRIAVKKVAVIDEEIRKRGKSCLELVIVHRVFPRAGRDLLFAIVVPAQGEILVHNTLCVFALGIAQNLGIQVQSRGKGRVRVDFLDRRPLRGFRIRR